MIATTFFLLLAKEADCKERSEGWILNGPDYHCTAKCQYEVYKPSSITNLTGCITDDIISLTEAKQEELGMCLREVNGLRELTTIRIPRKDYRFVCRPSKDRMTWYRGWQSVTFHNQSCIRWDKAPTRYTLGNFTKYSTPSLDHSTLKVFSATISQHENYCRNPDNHPYGPWCFYRDKNQIRRAPCFHTCVTDIKKLCLAKSYFPYYQTPYLLDGVPIAPVDRRILRKVEHIGLKKMNDRADLTDVLDVPDVIGSVEQATPLYSITHTTRHLMQARLAGSAVVTRKKCHQTGIRTLIAGPWTPIKDESLRFPEDSSGVKQDLPYTLRKYLSVQFLAGRQGIDKPWKPCFTACEDNMIKCWPKQTSKKPSERLFYFGSRVTNNKQRACLKWTEAMSVLYTYKAKHEKEVRDSKKGEKKEHKGALMDGTIDIDSAQCRANRPRFDCASITHRRNCKEWRNEEQEAFQESVALMKVQLLFYKELTERHTVNGKPAMNRFLDGGGRLLHSPICLDLARLIERDDGSAPKNGGLYQPFLEEAYDLMYNHGPGCFIWMDESQAAVEYSPCFKPCPCGTPSMTAPFKSYREMCRKQNKEYEPCIAAIDPSAYEVSSSHSVTRLPGCVHCVSDQDSCCCSMHHCGYCVYEH